MSHEEIQKKAEQLLPSQEFILKREQSIKKLGLAFDSIEAKLIVAMTDAFFIEGKLVVAKFIDEELLHAEK